MSSSVAFQLQKRNEKKKKIVVGNDAAANIFMAIVLMLDSPTDTVHGLWEIMN